MAGRRVHRGLGDAQAEDVSPYTLPAVFAPQAIENVSVASSLVGLRPESLVVPAAFHADVTFLKSLEGLNRHERRKAWALYRVSR